MARHDWIALVCEPMAEYKAFIDLQRYGLNPYLPQRKARCRLPDGKVGPIRSYPLFPPYLLLPFADIGDRVIVNACRGLRKGKRILADADGVLWKVPEATILQMREAEFGGLFDESLKIGDKVQINVPNLELIEAFVENSDHRLLTLMTPLLGGARVRVDRASVTMST